MIDMDMTVSLTDSIESESLVKALFWRSVLTARLTRVKIITWHTNASDVEVPGSEEVLHIDRFGWKYCLLQIRGHPVFLSLEGALVTARIGHGSAARPEPIIDCLKQALLPLAATEDSIAPFVFWTLGEHGSRSITRRLTVPSWEDIRENYSAATRDRVQGLVSGFNPARDGQLLLWSGEPGTGKTHALRALAWEWRRWCRFHYIVDPESFLDESRYLMDVVLDGDDDEEHGVRGESSKPQDRWRLLVLEDTGELLTPDAKERVGQGLSRLLNLADGLIGQGLKVLILVTTNEDIRSLHPAVSRAGRCAFSHQFDRLSTNEATSWLTSRGIRATIRGPRTIAELYGMLRGTSPRDESLLGFRASGDQNIAISADEHGVAAG